MDVSAGPGGITRVSGTEELVERSGRLVLLGRKTGSKFGDKLVDGDSATRRLGFQAGLRLGWEFKRHSHQLSVIPLNESAGRQATSTSASGRECEGLLRYEYLRWTNPFSLVTLLGWVSAGTSLVVATSNLV